MARVVLAWVLLALVCRAAAAEEVPRPGATFALIIGNNKSMDSELKPLRYADDDAARYFELFRTLGARTYLLTRPDDNTRRLHPQAVAESREPRYDVLMDVVQKLKDDIQTAHEKQVETTVYFIYAGHGNHKNGRGYIGLEDARLTGESIVEEVIEPLGADQVHIVVDACNSYYLAQSRGPGGSRRVLQGFSHDRGLAKYKKIGLLLSTSSGRDSHEWEILQAGVFSHEVRSGLYGAADADRDGWISYKEIASFVEQANRAIPNERYRPRVFARPPSSSENLIGLPGENPHILDVDGTLPAHYFIEDTQGVRLMDFNNGKGHSMRLLRPAARGLLYLHNADDSREYLIHPTPGVVKLSSLEPKSPGSQDRGAVKHAFSLLFSLPFDSSVVDSYRYPTLESVAPVATVEERVDSSRPWYRTAGWISLGIAGAAATSGVVLSLTTSDMRDSLGQNPSHEEALDLNREIRDRNVAAVTLYSVAGAAVVTGLFLLLWPDNPIQAGAVVSPDGDFHFMLGGGF